MSGNTQTKGSNSDAGPKRNASGTLIHGIADDPARMNARGKYILSRLGLPADAPAGDAAEAAQPGGEERGKEQRA